MAMRYLSRFNAAGGIADFWQEFRRPNPYRWPIIGLSMACTFALVYWVTQERVYLPPEKPKVSLIATYPAGRSDAEIIASNIENQKRKELRAAEQAKRDQEVKDAYRALGRATGLDVDAMERDIARKKAAEEVRLEARRKELAEKGQTIGEPL